MASEPPIIRHEPFLDRGALSGRWYWIESYRQYPDGHREAHVKWDVDDAIRRVRAEAAAEALEGLVERYRTRSMRGPSVIEDAKVTAAELREKAGQ